MKGHTQGLEDLAVEMLARGLSVRDIEDAFNLVGFLQYLMRQELRVGVNGLLLITGNLIERSTMKWGASDRR
jgi:hypothetical protein